MLQQNNFGRRAFVLNFTQHAWSNDQRVELESKGFEVVDMDTAVVARVKELLTFDTLPTREEIYRRADELAAIAKSFISRNDEGLRNNDVGLCMIGGAPYFQSALEFALLEVGINPIYAFSQRVSEEVTKEDGTVEKRNVFRHEGFVFPQRSW